MFLQVSIQKPLFFSHFFEVFESESQKTLFFISLFDIFDISNVWGKGMATKKSFSILKLASHVTT